MNEKLTVCHTCLSKDRELCPIQKLQDLLKYVHLNLNCEGGLCWECKGIILKFLRFRKQVELAQNLHQKAFQQLKSLSNLTYSNTTYSYVVVTDPLTSDTDQKHIKLEVDKTIDNSDFHFHEKPSLESGEETEINTLGNSNNDYEEKHLLELDGLENEVNTIGKSGKETKNVVKRKGKRLRSKINQLNDNIDYKEGNSDDDYRDTPELDSDFAIEKRITKKKVKRLKRPKQILKEDLDYDDVKDKFVEVEFTEEEVMKIREEKRNHPNFKKLPYNCDSCVLGFTRKENLDMHMDKKHNEDIGPHVCPVCRVRFPLPTTLSKHLRKHFHSYRCQLCVFETGELWAARGHCRSKHRGDSVDSIHCRQCDYVAKGREELSEHTRTTHTLICAECGEKFKGPETLRTHKRRVHGTIREHKCDTCPRAFKSRGRLEAHMTSHGPAAAARLAYCVLCRVQYKNIYVYRNHLMHSANHSERRFHCEECGKKFASKDYYKRHYTFYHQKKSKFKCELCDRLFISAWRLRQHAQLRHGAVRARSHACDQCPKKFYSGSTLRAHRLTHSSQRTLMCADCGHTFKQRAALYTHTRRLHPAHTNT